MADWNPQANDIFLKALDIRSPEERLAFLDGACAENANLRAQVEALLAASDQAGSFLESPVTALNATNNQPFPEQPGTVIGPYKLLQQIGEGGMGVVYMAQQTEPVERRLALKIIKPGMDSRKVIARFEAERQALALMDHPNIAKVLDAGTTDSGRPYFVMELVKGLPITQYCDEKHLTVRQRLELLLPVCQAVQHAHQKGIIHRDIKPSNVMIALYDGRPVPKVIDFGVAKATGSRLTDKTVFTEFGQVVGTMEYMSPEQAELNQLDVDTRSDIYSLGVLLYELLTGTTPLERKRLCAAAFDEMLRMIREEEPPKPSTRLSTTNEGASIAANRGMEPKKLSGLVRGELDWIVMKALEKDRSRRYETANGLAMDISRYLADEAVQACPPSATYRFRKFARSNRVALTTAVLISAALVLGTAVSTWQAIRAEAARVAEAEQRKVAESAPAEADQRTVAEEQRNEAERQRAQADANFEQARSAVDDYFNTVSESKLLDVPGLEPLRKELLESALKYYEGFVDQHDDDSGRLADLVVAHLRVGMILYSNGDGPDRWLPHMTQAIEILEPLVRTGHDTPEAQRRLAGWFRSNTDPRHWQGKWQGGEEDRLALDRELNRFAEIWEKFVRDNPSVPEFQNDLAGIYFYIGANQAQAGKTTDAIRTGKRVLEIWEKLSHDYPQEPRYRLDLARVYDTFAGFQTSNPLLKKEGQKNRQKALALREQVVQEFPQVAGYRTQLGLNYSAAAMSAENPDEAEQLSRKAYEQLEKVAAAFPTMQSARFDLAREQQRLGDFLVRRGKHADAIELYRRSIGLWEGLAAEAPDQWKNRANLARTWLNLADALVKDGKPTEGDDAYRQAAKISQIILEAFVTQLPTDPQIRFPFAIWLKEFAEQISSQPDSIGLREELHRRSLALSSELANEFPRETKYAEHSGHIHRYLGWITREADRPDEALDNFDKAVGIFKRLGEVAPKTGYYRDAEADSRLQQVLILAAAGRNDAAEITARHVAEMYEALARQYPNHLDYRRKAANAHQVLADRLGAAGKHQESENVVRLLITDYEKLVADFPDNRECRALLTRSYTNLSEVLLAQNKLPEALIEARNAVRASPNEFQGHDRLLELLNKIGDKEQTLAVLRENVDAMPDSAIARQHLATVLAQQGQSAGAQEIYGQLVAMFEKLAADHPNEPNYRVEMGHNLWQVANLSSGLGQQDEAEKAHRQALDVFEKLAAEFPMVPFYRMERGFSNWHVGFLMRNIGRPREAEEPMRQALDIHAKLTADFPNEREYRARLAQSYDALIEALVPQGKQAEVEETLHQAMKMFEELAAAHPDIPDFLRLRADSFHRLAQFQTSNKQVKEAEETDRQAIDTYQTIIAKFPQHEDLGMFYMNLAPLLAGSDRPVEAADAYRKAFQRIPNNADALNSVAWTLAGSEDVRLRNPELAVEFANKATELRPQDANFQNTLGVAHYRAADWQQAIDWLDKSMKGRNGGDSKDWFFLAMAHQQLGHKDEARKWLDQAVAWIEKHAPQNEGLLRLRHEAEDLLIGKPAVDANSKSRE